MVVTPLLIYLFSLVAAVLSVRKSRRLATKGKALSSQGQRVGMLYNRCMPECGSTLD
jgi:hypothetical protein